VRIQDISDTADFTVPAALIFNEFYPVFSAGFCHGAIGAIRADSG
jgi:hypothetical protein